VPALSRAFMPSSQNSRRPARDRFGVLKSLNSHLFRTGPTAGPAPVLRIRPAEWPI
jgi:hypothetical protein